MRGATGSEGGQLWLSAHTIKDQGSAFDGGLSDGLLSWQLPTASLPGRSAGLTTYRTWLTWGKQTIYERNSSDEE